MIAQDIARTVRERLTAIPERATMPDDELRRLVEQQIDSVQLLPNFAGVADPDVVRRAVINDLLGFGPIQELLDDASISEIMVNGPGDIWIERSGMLSLSNSTFESPEQMLRIIDRMVRSSGRRVDQSSPMVDARLPDGSRLNVVLPPLSVDGPAITIRKFTSSNLGIDELVASETVSADAASFLKEAVATRMNVLVSGGTGTGKTTVLNILSSFVSRDERVVTIEDAVELTLRLPNLIRLEARPSNSEGVGEVNIRDLVRNALRMRPNRIVVGEVRGGETIDMLQAMNTGHEGSLSTVHANSPRDALRRLETMVLLAGVDLPLRAVREQIASSIDVIVHLARDARGRRFVTTVTEIVGMESDVVSTADLFSRDFGRIADESLPPLESTGLVSSRLGMRRARRAA